MPLNKFICPICKSEYSKLTKSTVVSITCLKTDCGYEAVKQLPQSTSTMIMETKDTHRGTQVRKGLQEKLKTRMTIHHDKYELADKIDKNGTDDAQRLGWLKKTKRTNA